MIDIYEILYSPLISIYRIQQYCSLVFESPIMHEYIFINLSEKIEQTKLTIKSEYSSHNTSEPVKFSKNEKNISIINIRNMLTFNKKGIYEFVVVEQLNNYKTFHTINVIVNNESNKCSIL